MDVNYLLSVIRETVKSVEENGYSDDPGTPLEDLVVNFSNLDEWLSKGGFLPTDWSK